MPSPPPADSTPTELALIDLSRQKTGSWLDSPSSQSWFGLGDAAIGRRADLVVRGRQLRLGCIRSKLEGSPPESDRAAPEPPALKKAGRSRRPESFPGRTWLGTPHRPVLYSVDVDAGTLGSLDPNTLRVIKSAPVGSRPYDVAVARNGAQLFVSDRAAAGPRVVDPEDLRTVARIAVGEHPNQIAVHPLDDRIFVACASSDCVSVIDTRRGIVTETIHTALFPRAPEGSTPDALAVAPDGKTLYVANADNNCVAVIDIGAAGRIGEGLRANRLVSHRGGHHPRRQEPADRRRQGQPDQGQPDRQGLTA